MGLEYCLSEDELAIIVCVKLLWQCQVLCVGVVGGLMACTNILFFLIVFNIITDYLPILYIN